VLWCILAVVAALMKGGISGDKCNNFLIFRQVYYHLVEQKSLYAAYPQEHGDVNHYGPVFALIIAVFALLPKLLGMMTWLIAMAATLYATLMRMPLKRVWIMAVCWIITQDLLSAMQMAQFNIVIVALVLLSYIAVEKERDWLAALCIAIGALTKVYGIVAIVFVLFSRHKVRFIGWLAVWTAILVAAPMLLSSPEYVAGQYAEWGQSLLDKNALNVALGLNTTDNYYQNISVMGMLHRITQSTFSDMYVLIPAVVLFVLPLLRRKQWGAERYRLGVLASALMCIILFSTGSETSGYVIAMTGVAIWYVACSQRSRTDVALLVLALVISSFGTSDLMPSPIRKGLIRPYSLKALPVLLVWLKLTYELCIRNYRLEPPILSQEASAGAENKAENREK
jgi:hypothetical protein